MPPHPRDPTAYLLVEGKDDFHVIMHLCRRRGLAPFDIREPSEGGGESGIAELLVGIPRRLREPQLRTLGIVIDADLDLSARWQAVRARLVEGGQVDVPSEPSPDGWVSSTAVPIRVGVWLMPDNILPGILEDFVASLIPPDDLLQPKATAIVDQIEQENLRRYPAQHRPKALIHTWLAWQENPGQPMGLAITATALGHTSPVADVFVSWLRRLFDPSPSPQAV